MDPQTQTPAGAQTPGTSIDPTALALSRAIRTVESNGNYNAVGDKGQSHGAYQFNGDNFQRWAKQYGLDPNDFSETNQDHLAYVRIKDLLDKGLSQSEVAAVWNGAKQVNGRPVAIVPQYVEKVKNAYNQHASALGQTYGGYQAPDYSKYTSGTPQPDQSQTEEKSLGQQLSGRASDISNAVNQTIQGKINPVSGVLQTVGAAAGGLGDVVNKGLELIPGVKQLEGLIGKGVGALASTPAGQSVVKAIKGFTDAHPELSADIGAGFNIATAIPIFEGLGAIKNLAMDSVGSALQDVAKKSVVEGTADAMGYTKTLSRALVRNGGKDTVAGAMDLVGKDGVAAIEGGKYATQDAFENVGRTISNIEDTQLQPALQKASTMAVSDRLPLEQLRQDALASIRDEFKATGSVGRAESEVNRVFDDYQRSYGDYVTLQDVNDMKRGIRTSVNFNSPKLDSDVTYHIGQTFQKSIEDSANRLGLGDVHAINQQMATLIKYQDMLKALDKTPARIGKIRRFITHGVGAGAGGVVGGIVGGGTPGAIIGSYVGNEASNLFGKKSIGGLTGNLVKSAGQGALRTGLKTTAGKVGGLVGAALAQKATR